MAHLAVAPSSRGRQTGRYRGHRQTEGTGPGAEDHPSRAGPAAVFARQSVRSGNTNDRWGQVKGVVCLSPKKNVPKRDFETCSLCYGGVVNTPKKLDRSGVPRAGWGVGAGICLEGAAHASRCLWFTDPQLPPWGLDWGVTWARGRGLTAATSFWQGHPAERCSVLSLGPWEPPGEKNGETVGPQALPTWLQGLVSQGLPQATVPCQASLSYPATGLLPSKPSSSFRKPGLCC